MTKNDKKSANRQRDGRSRKDGGKYSRKDRPKPQGRPPINDGGGTSTTKGTGDFLRRERKKDNGS